MSLKKFCFFLIFTLTCFLPHLVNAEKVGKISIQLEESLLSVDIQGANLPEVIEELNKVVEIDVQFDDLSKEDVINLKFDGLPLAKAVQQLFPNAIILDSKYGAKYADSITKPTGWFSSLKSWFSATLDKVIGKTPSTVVSIASKTLASNSKASPAPIKELPAAVTSPKIAKSSPVKTLAAVASSPNKVQSVPVKVSPQLAPTFKPVSPAPVKVSPPIISFQEVAAFGSMTSKAQSGKNVVFARTFFPPGNSKTAAALTSGEVTSIVTNAANSLNNSDNMHVAVVDRQGTILGTFSKAGGLTANSENTAVALARTAAFFSHNQAAITSRTVRFISGEHFPPGIKFTPNGALFGIEHNNRGCDLNMTYLGGQSFPQALRAAGGTCENGTTTGCGQGIMTIPGSFPLYKGNTLVGGIGVFGIGPALTDDPQGGLRKLGTGYEAAEFAAVSGAVGFEPPQFSGGGIFIDGIRLPGVKQTTRPSGFSNDANGFANGAFRTVAAANGTAAGSTSVPSGFLVGPTAGGAFTVADLNKIINQARAEAKLTRGAIRLPYTETARMVFAIGDINGNILAVYRQSDSTVFSLDVAVTKARNVTYFSGSNVNAADQVAMPVGTAVTNRTISFGSQRFFPSGLDFAGPGPYRNVFTNDAANPCTQGRDTNNTANQSGIVFFPGSVPLYKNGALIGGLGVSGDGVEQDDLVAAAGAVGFEPPAGIRSDQYKISDVRMPYLKYPRNPKNLGN
tara:strand:- start:675 stop:2888 length:2214 start_codon:yes stop_codon:yes gene_type:complete